MTLWPRLTVELKLMFESSECEDPARGFMSKCYCILAMFLLTKVGSRWSSFALCTCTRRVSRAGGTLSLAS